jgi:hypothetical protein
LFLPAFEHPINVNLRLSREIGFADIRDKALKLKEPRRVVERVGSACDPRIKNAADL